MPFKQEDEVFPGARPEDRFPMMFPGLFLVLDRAGLILIETDSRREALTMARKRVNARATDWTGEPI